jgi:hypothetical protein
MQALMILEQVPLPLSYSLTPPPHYRTAGARVPTADDNVGFVYTSEDGFRHQLPFL